MFFATLRVARIALMTRCRRPRSETESVSPPSSSDQRRAIRYETCSITGVRRSIAGESGHQDAESANETPDGNPARPGGEAQAEGRCEDDDDRVPNADPAKQGRHARSSQRRQRLRDIAVLGRFVGGG